MSKQYSSYIVDISSGKIENSNQNVNKNIGNKNNLSNKIIKFIDNEINIANKNKYQKLVLLFEQYNFAADFLKLIE